MFFFSFRSEVVIIRPFNVMSLKVVVEVLKNIFVPASNVTFAPDFAVMFPLISSDVPWFRTNLVPVSKVNPFTILLLKSFVTVAGADNIKYPGELVLLEEPIGG